MTRNELQIYCSSSSISSNTRAATAITADSAFATKYKGKNQAVSQVNDCGNGAYPLNVGCQNTVSQVQGHGNYVNLDSAQSFPRSNLP